MMATPTIRSTIPRIMCDSEQLAPFLALDLEGLEPPADFLEHYAAGMGAFIEAKLHEMGHGTLTFSPKCLLSTKTDEQGVRRLIYNIQTIQRLMDSGCRKNDLAPSSNQAIRDALDGGINPKTGKVYNAQFQPHAGFRLSGFGLPNHLKGLKMGWQALKTAKEKLTMHFGDLVCTAPPDFIAKMMKGDLAWHTDGGTLSFIFEKCLLHVNEDNFDAWGDWQILVHAVGAGSGPQEAGHTITLSPLTPFRLAIIIAMMNPASPFPGLPPAKWDSAGGPLFYPYDEHLSKFNDAIKYFEGGLNDDLHLTPQLHSWISKTTWIDLRSTFSTYHKIHGVKSPMSEMKVVKMIPLDHVNSTPYLIAWPNGAPHAALALGEDRGPRLTFALSLHQKRLPASELNRRQASDKFNSRTRLPKVLRALAKGDLDEIRKDTAPYQGGAVHSHPEIEATIYPFFRHLYLSEQETEEIIEALFTTTDRED